MGERVKEMGERVKVTGMYNPYVYFRPNISLTKGQFPPDLHLHNHVVPVVSVHSISEANVHIRRYPPTGAGEEFSVTCVQGKSWKVNCQIELL